MHRLRPALAALLALTTLLSLSGLAGAQGERRLYLPALPNGAPSPGATATRTATTTTTTTTSATASATTGTPTVSATASATSATPTGSATASATSATPTSATPTDTATASATPTESATPTSSATTTPEPPAGSCRVYPIAVWGGYIQGSAFLNPGADAPGAPPSNWRLISGGDFDGYTARRIYLRQQADVPGGYAYLSWLPNTSSTALESSLRAPGDIDQGFEEAPWPAGQPNPPAAYPAAPGELNAGDWAHSYASLSRSGEFVAIMADHIGSARRLALPIFDEGVGMGSSGAIYHITGFGLFTLAAYGRYQGVEYVDLVYLGEVATLCPGTNLPPPPTPAPATGL